MAKIIHVLAHNIEDFIAGPYEGLEHHSIAFMEKIRVSAQKVNFRIEQELWTLSKTKKEVKNIEHKKGFKIRLFPISIKLPFPLEISLPLLKEIFLFKHREKTIWHIHSYYLFMTDLMAPLLFFKKQKFLTHYRGGGPSFTPKALPYTIYHYLIGLRIALNLANFILVQNHDEEKRVIKFLGIKKNKVVYLPNSISKNKISRTKESNNDFFKIIVAGREEKLKNKKWLRRLFEDLLSENKKMVIEIVGVKNKNKLGSILEFEKTFKKRFLILPWLRKKDLLKKYRAVDIYFHPNTKNVFEGSPNTVIEAQSQGLPVVAFDIEGVRDIIKDGFNGYLVKNMKDAAKVIKELAVKKRNLPQISANALSIIERNFTDEKYFPKLISIYRSLVK